MFTYERRGHDASLKAFRLLEPPETIAAFAPEDNQVRAFSNRRFSGAFSAGGPLRKTAAYFIVRPGYFRTSPFSSVDSFRVLANVWFSQNLAQ